MDFSNIGRNDLCPCGSGKKFKRCHMGREKDIVTDRLTQDPGQTALAITKLPVCDHPRATEMIADFTLASPAGKTVRVKLVDLAAYAQLQAGASDAPRSTSGGVLINPHKTRVLDPTHVYLALSRDADESLIIHQLAHAADLICGSSLPPGKAQALSHECNLPVELLEHPQEFGDQLLALSDQYGVELDAEDEIVAFLARRQMLLPGRLIAGGNSSELVAAAEKTMRVLQDNKDEINARIKNRAGYVGDK
ncbi:MAG: SEC-C domain-containing protein [Desulfarculaceae bacterium]|nr:SEC-C domain-containing protein [Desulfarculaceae bacterium]MCF8102120.1 SEC-C domain-containing protein [Desulfarculaceae bacterium]MCF8118335.1 SEC-C domain-containing protein [Desulfarculaceae bacterium]